MKDFNDDLLEDAVGGLSLKIPKNDKNHVMKVKIEDCGYKFYEDPNNQKFLDLLNSGKKENFVGEDKE
ncbi:MAG: hypothetical protein LBK29_03880 [Oscillospiraceae bacterium]|jgi:hypothetical protein|nr:hypothetical protein [Oscillospiraceae bacterium]